MAVKNGVSRMMDTVEAKSEGTTHDNAREETARLPDIAYVISVAIQIPKRCRSPRHH